MFEDMNNLVNDFFEKSDEFVDKMKKYEEEKKNYVENDETSQYQVMGNTAEVEDVKNDI